MPNPDDLSALFAFYCDAFSRGDAHAVASHYHYPAHILGQAEVPRMIGLKTTDEMSAVAQTVIARYEQLGFSAAKITSLQERYRITSPACMWSGCSRASSHQMRLYVWKQL